LPTRIATDDQRFAVRADERLTAFVEFESAISRREPPSDGLALRTIGLLHRLGEIQILDSGGNVERIIPSRSPSQNQTHCPGKDCETAYLTWQTLNRSW
jgi:hypothetical protein